MKSFYVRLTIPENQFDIVYSLDHQFCNFWLKMLICKETMTNSFEMIFDRPAIKSFYVLQFPKINWLRGQPGSPMLLQFDTLSNNSQYYNSSVKRQSPTSLRWFLIGQRSNRSTFYNSRKSIWRFVQSGPSIL